MSVLLDQSGAPIPPSAIDAVRQSAVSASLGSAVRPNSYAGASRTSQELALFPTITLSADGSSRWESQPIRNRVRDLERNAPTVGTAVRKSAGMVIGSGWKLRAKVDAAILGLTEDQADALNASIEREFRLWATDPNNYCDAKKRHGFGMLMNRVYHEYKRDGEALNVMIWREEGQRYATGIQQIDVDRLSNPHNLPDDLYLRGGIEIDQFEAPIAFHIQDAHPTDYYAGGRQYNWTRYPVKDTIGRPFVIHLSRTTRAGQTRAVSEFAPLIEKLAMQYKMEKLHLQAALNSAIFSLYVRSGYDAESVAEMLGMDNMGIDNWTGLIDAKVSHYKTQAPVVNDFVMPVLPPGDEIKAVTAGQNPNDAIAFMKAINQTVAAAVGVAEGQISGDYNGLNYSTLRGAYNEIYSDVKIARADFNDQFVRKVYFCVIDEALRKNYIEPPAGVPDLYDAPAAWTQSEWIGPARGHIDAEKGHKGNLLALEGGWKTLTEIAAEEGRELEDIFRDRREQNRLAEKYDDELPVAREGAFAPTQNNGGQ